jgi:hypothetical protein
MTPMKPIFKSIAVFAATTLLVACSVGPTNYGDHEGSLLNFAIQKNVFAAYAGDVQTLDKVGVVALDNKIYVRGITTQSGEKITPQVFSIGPKFLKTDAQNQYHFLPGKYVVAACFVMDAGNGNTTRCRDDVNVALDIQAGSTVQWVVAWPTRNTWNVLQRPPTESASAKIVADFKKIMIANNQKAGSDQ